MDALKISCLTLRFAVVDGPLRFHNFPGSAWRGVFGRSLFRLTCLGGKGECERRCSRPTLCLYGRVFAPPRKEGAKLGYHDPPRPFALRCPAESRALYATGAEYELQMTLLGEAVNWAPAIVAAIKQAAWAGVGAARTSLELIAGDEEYVSIRRELPRSDAVTLRFLAPTRIVRGGSLVKAPEFPVLLRAVLRRVMAIEELCGLPHRWDAASLLNAAEAVRLADAQVWWWDWHRKSGRTQQVMPFGGFVGDLTYEEDLTPFAELIQLGSWLNVGKHATFGMGRYEVAE